MTPEVPCLITKRTPSRRCWFRYSLRSFLIFTTLVAGLLSLVTKERRQSELEQQVGTKLREQGAFVVTLGLCDSLELYNKNEPKGWWRGLARRVLGKRIFRIQLRDDQYDLKLLAGLGSLEGLGLIGAAFSDLTPLAGLKNLEVLSLVDTSVSDLTPLARLTNLKSLVLNGTAVADDQIEILQQALPNCQIDR